MFRLETLWLEVAGVAQAPSAAGLLPPAAGASGQSAPGCCSAAERDLWPPRAGRREEKRGASPITAQQIKQETSGRGLDVCCLMKEKSMFLHSRSLWMLLLFLLFITRTKTTASRADFLGGKDSAGQKLLHFNFGEYLLAHRQPAFTARASSLVYCRGKAQCTMWHRDVFLCTVPLTGNCSILQSFWPRAFFYDKACAKWFSRVVHNVM